MSKIIPENISTISERLIKVLTDNGLVKKNGEVNFSAAERQCGMKGTVLQKAVKRNGGLYDDNLDKFLRTFQVKREWLLKGIGDIYNENPTPAINSSNNMVNEAFSREGVYTSLIERNSNYQILPTRLLNEYKIIPNNMIDTHDTEIKAMDKAIAAQDRVIARYEVEIKEKETEIHRLKTEIDGLRSKLGPQPAQ